MHLWHDSWYAAWNASRGSYSGSAPESSLLMCTLRGIRRLLRLLGQPACHIGVLGWVPSPWLQTGLCWHLGSEVAESSTHFPLLLFSVSQINKYLNKIGKKILQREHIGHINLGGKIKDRYCQPNQTDFLKFLSHGKFGEKGISRGPGNVGIYTVVVYGLKPFGWCDISHGHSHGWKAAPCHVCLREGWRSQPGRALHSLVEDVTASWRCRDQWMSSTDGVYFWWVG